MLRNLKLNLHSVHSQHLLNSNRFSLHLLNGLLYALLEWNEAVGQWRGLTLGCSPILHHQFSLCFKQLLFSSISNLTAFTFSCSSSSSSWRFDSIDTIHPCPCFCPGQCGGNRGSLAQSQRHKSNTRNWEIKIGLIRNRLCKYEIVCITQSTGSYVFKQLQNAKCNVVHGQIRWQLHHPAAGRPFCTWDRWRYSSYLVPFPVDEWNKRKLMIPVRNNTFELTVMNETTLNIRIPSSSGYKMCVNREAKAVCAGHC